MKPNMAATMVNLPSVQLPSRFYIYNHFHPITIPETQTSTQNSNPRTSTKSIRFPAITYCLNTTNASSSSPPPMKKTRRRYRKRCPGEDEGITGEIRFVAMKLRTNNGNVRANKSDESDDESSGNDVGSDDVDGGNDRETSGWEPSVKGFVKYLVDSKLVFSTVERLVDESQDVSYAYFRKTGLERSESFTKDLDWFSQQNIPISNPSNPGKNYAKYLEELAEQNPPLFLCHFYNIYFSHLAGGQVIAKQVSEKILEGRELESCLWQGDAEELLKGVREKLNALGEHWTRQVRSKCLKESTKSFRYLGQIIRLIIL